MRLGWLKAVVLVIAAIMLPVAAGQGHAQEAQEKQTEDCPFEKGWKPEKLTRILEEHRKWAARWEENYYSQEWAKNHPEGRASLCNADLAGANLSKTVLSGANLSKASLLWANLTEADLYGANLSEAALIRANLSKTVLSGANLSKADLLGANLSKADLSKANLTEAELFETNLSKAVLSGADLGEAVLVWANLAEAALNEANLSKADLRGANLSKADLRRANLTGADLFETNLSKTVLSGANLSKADLLRANLSKADLRRANLSKADLRRTNLTGADLSGANLSKATLSGANLSKATLSEADLTEANLFKTNLSKTDLSKANVTEAGLGGANLTEADLSEANLSKAFLGMADLSKADLRGANLSKADLRYANLSKADLYRTNLTGASLDRANLTNAVYAPASPPPDPYLEGIRGLSTVQFPKGSGSGLVQLRELLQKAGLRDLEREATYALESNKTSHLITGERKSLLNVLEGIFRLAAFEWTTGYGLYPGRALLIIVGFGVLLIPIYAWPIRCPPRSLNSLSGLYRIWPSDRIAFCGDELAVDNKTEVERLQGGDWQALGYGAYFSLLSAFHIGWRDLSIGTWVTRVQPQEYTLKPTGWVRLVSGLQSLLSVYLLAIWALTYFGRPFQ